VTGPGSFNNNGAIDKSLVTDGILGAYCLVNFKAKLKGEIINIFSRPFTGFLWPAFPCTLPFLKNPGDLIKNGPKLLDAPCFFWYL
jgi:hypothetical protein